MSLDPPRVFLKMGGRSAFYRVPVDISNSAFIVDRIPRKVFLTDRRTGTTWSTETGPVELPKKTKHNR